MRNFLTIVLVMFFGMLAHASELDCTSKLDGSGSVFRVFSFMSKPGFLSQSERVLQLGYYDKKTGSEQWRRQFESVSTTIDGDFLRIRGIRKSISGRFDLEINVSIDFRNRQAKAVVSGDVRDYSYDLICSSLLQSAR